MNHNYKRGSEWRKWDLHVHSPYTKLKNDFNGCSNNDFIQKIKEQNISVIGLTNYFKFDENDFKLKQELKKQNIKVFLNLELRLTYQNKEGKNCDFHIIFSNDLTKETIQQFLCNLTLKVDGTEKKANNLENENDFNNATVEFEDLLKKLNDESLNLKNKYLLGFLSRGYGNSRSSTQYENLAKRCHFIIHASDKNENIKEDRAFWLKNKKPLLQSSDAHKLENIGSKFTWIKADPTFEGLKQIIYEPESRVRIQEHKPEEKVSYQVIQSVEIDHEDCKQKIKFNSNLNTIIGGRSTGKSTLLKVIANKLKADSNFKEEYIEELTKNATIKWQDDEEKNDREIEYFEQNHMHIIAKNKKNEKDELLEKIVKEKDIQNLLKDYENFCENNEINIQNKLDELFNIQNKIEIENKNLKENGDKKGVENEIEKIKEKIKKIGNKNFTEENRKNFEKIKEGILSNENTIKKFENDISIIEKIKNEQLFNNSVSYNFGELLMVKKEVSEKFEEIKKEFEKKWHEELDTKKEELNKKIKELKGENEKTKDEEIYKRGLQYLEENKQHKELEERLKKEKEKLEKIKNIEEKIKENKKSKKELFEKIIRTY